MATGTIMLIIGAASTAVSAYGAYQQGQQEAAANKYNAQVQNNITTIDEQQAQLQAQQDARQTALRRGTIAANSGASGGTLSGSALDVLGDVTTQSNLQTNEDKYAGDAAAYAHTTNAQTDTQAAKDASNLSILNAGNALLKGSSTLGSNPNINVGG